MRKHNLNDGDVVVIGKHELSYARLQPDDARLTLTTVLNESEEDTDDDGADDGEENDGEVYSSRARGL